MVKNYRKGNKQERLTEYTKEIKGKEGKEESTD